MESIAAYLKIKLIYGSRVTFFIFPQLPPKGLQLQHFIGADAAVTAMAAPQLACKERMLLICIYRVTHESRFREPFLFCDLCAKCQVIKRENVSFCF